jgi:hypothetical protein
MITLPIVSLRTSLLFVDVPRWQYKTRLRWPVVLEATAVGRLCVTSMRVGAGRQKLLFLRVGINVKTSNLAS